MDVAGTGLISVASVQHSGTRFTRKLLRRGRDGIPNAHFGQNYIHTLRGKVITPLRRLDRIIQSWERRDMDFSTLHRAIGEMIAYPVDFYFPIDSDDREKYLSDLSDFVGYELQTDWFPEGSGQKSGLFQPRNPEVRELILEDYSEWFNQFYA